jgi:hypothetical protein
VYNTKVDNKKLQESKKKQPLPNPSPEGRELEAGRFQHKKNFALIFGISLPSGEDRRGFYLKFAI